MQKLHAEDTHNSNTDVISQHCSFSIHSWCGSELLLYPEQCLSLDLWVSLFFMQHVTRKIDVKMILLPSTRLLPGTLSKLWL